MTGEMSKANHQQKSSQDFRGQSVTVANYLMEANGWITETENAIGGGVIRQHEQNLRVCLAGIALHLFLRRRWRSILFTFKQPPRTQRFETNYEYRNAACLPAGDMWDSTDT